MPSKNALLLLFAFFSLLATAPSHAVEVKSIQCGSGFSNSFQLASITDQKLTVNLGVLLTGEEDLYPLIKTSKGDCQRHSNYLCYLSGQMMVNLPKNTFTFEGNQIRVWLNMDVDDDTTNSGLGVSYLCTIQ